MVAPQEEEETFREEFDITATVSFVLRNGFQRVALQFPDELLKHSVAVSSALNKEFSKQIVSCPLGECGTHHVRLFVMADTTFGSCCADEVAAMHIDAQCIVHYGHACMSLTSRLPVWFVFGRATINAENCATCIAEFAAGSKQPVLVIFGLKYIYAVPSIQEKVAVIQGKDLDITFASTPSQLMQPLVNGNKHEGGSHVARARSSALVKDTILDTKVDICCQSGKLDGQYHDNHGETSCSSDAGACVREVPKIGAYNCAVDGSEEYKLGGLRWIVPRGRSMEEYIILWIGADDPGLTNVSLIFNLCRVIRYDGPEEKIVTDVANQSRLLQRRYYFVERAKDANVVGIVVGTLGVAGYGEVIQRVRRMVEAAGKKAYTLVMGKPNPSKLANFPECEVFVLVACPQTALLDSKDYLAPLITPFEAELAFLEGKQWTGAYNLDFAVTDPAARSTLEPMQETHASQPRFSFFTGGYVGKNHSQGQDDEDVPSRAVVLSKSSQHALELQSESSLSIIATERSVLDIKSGAEYLASRTYKGLEMSQEGSREASLAVVGRQGRAAGYKDEDNIV